jgi:hypothetical protein
VGTVTKLESGLSSNLWGSASKQPDVRQSVDMVRTHVPAGLLPCRSPSVHSPRGVPESDGATARAVCLSDIRSAPRYAQAPYNNLEKSAEYIAKLKRKVRGVRGIPCRMGYRAR